MITDKMMESFGNGIKSKARTCKQSLVHILRIDKLSILDNMSFKNISSSWSDGTPKKKKNLRSLIRNSNTLL